MEAVEATQKEEAVLGHDRETQGEGAREREEAYGVPLHVSLLQLADRQVVVVDGDDRACQIREKPRTMAS